MKKIIKIIMLVLIFSMFIGCEKKEDNKELDNKKNVIEIEVDGITIKLDYKREFKDMSFIIPSSSQTMTVGTYFFCDYMNGEDFIFRIATYYFENKTVEETMEGSSESSLGTKTINGREWHIYKDVSQNGENILNYVYQNNNDTYTITFIYVKDLNDFIDTFMKLVDFK